jgi:hypothetical protein
MSEQSASLHLNEPARFSHAELKLVTEHDKNIEAPTKQELAHRVDEIRDHYRATGIRNEASRSAAWSKFVDNEPSADVALFSGVMLRGVYDVEYNNRHEELKKELKIPNNKSEVQLLTDRAELRRVKSFLVDSNHSIRNLIESQGEVFTLDELSTWYGRSNGGHVHQATSRVIAVASELAVMATLVSMPEVRSVNYGTNNQDRRGGDIITRFDDGSESGKEVWIDVKSGRQVPTGSEHAGVLNLTVGIPRNLMDAHGHLDQHNTEGMQTLIRLAVAERRQNVKKPGLILTEVGALGLVEPLTAPHSLREAFFGSSDSHGEFRARAELIVGEVRQAMTSGDLPSVLNELKDKYLGGTEDDIELTRLTSILLNSRQQALLQDQLNRDRLQLHSGELTHDEKISVGTHYELLRREACEFNHALRLLMENNAEDFTREELTLWVGKASQGRYKWAEGEITGAVSEIAVHAALQGLPELQGVRYGTVDEDLVGYDFVCTWQGQILSVDAKTGHYPPVEELKHGHRHIEVSVPREIIKDFTATKRGLSVIRFDIRHALKAEIGIPVHVSHQHYS